MSSSFVKSVCLGRPGRSMTKCVMGCLYQYSRQIGKSLRKNCRRKRIQTVTSQLVHPPAVPCWVEVDVASTGLFAEAIQVLLRPDINALALEHQRAAEWLQLVAGQDFEFSSRLQDHGRAPVAAGVEAIAGQR